MQGGLAEVSGYGLRCSNAGRDLGQLGKPLAASVDKHGKAVHYLGFDKGTIDIAALEQRQVAGDFHAAPWQCRKLELRAMDVGLAGVDPILGQCLEFGVEGSDDALPIGLPGLEEKIGGAACRERRGQ